jgi:hypothetical protein
MAANEIIFIIARERPDLYEYVVKGFEDVPQVKVIYDRRLGERRRGSGDAPGPERRRGDRRLHRERDDLRGLGWVLVRAED